MAQKIKKEAALQGGSMSKKIKIQVMVSEDVSRELVEVLENIPPRLRAEKMRTLALLGLRASGSSAHFAKTATGMAGQQGGKRHVKKALQL